MCCRVDSQQSMEAVDLPLTCHPAPSFTTFAFRSSEVRRLLLLFFLRELLMLWSPALVWCFGGLFVWVVSRLAGDRSISPQFRKVHRPLLLPITDKFPKPQYCLRCLSAWCLFVLDDLWNAFVCFEPPSLLIGKVWVPVINIFPCPIHCRVHWIVGKRLGSFRLVSVQPLIESTIWVFYKSSALWVLEILSCLY